MTILSSGLIRDLHVVEVEDGVGDGIADEADPVELLELGRVVIWIGGDKREFAGRLAGD